MSLRHAEVTCYPDSESGCSVIDMQRRKPGPEGKGERKQIPVRFPVAHFAVYEREAERLGLSWGDYVARTMALAHELDLPAYLQVGDPPDPLAEAS